LQEPPKFTQKWDVCFEKYTIWQPCRQEGFFSSKLCRSRATIKSGLPDFSWYKVPKRKNIPYCHKLYQMSINLTKDCKMDQVSIKSTNFFQCKTLQNLPKFGFFGLKTNHLATLNQIPISGTAETKELPSTG
jgi:hypothetical protein